MRYFLYELFEAQNRDDVVGEALAKVDAQWEENVAAYERVFTSIHDRLPTSIVQHFSGWGSHDSRIINIQFEQTSFLRLHVHLTISNAAARKKDEKLSRLSFQDVSHFQFQHLNARNDACVLQLEMDDWLYEEFLPINDNTLSFEVLLSSSANILIHFPNHGVTMTPIE